MAAQKRLNGPGGGVLNRRRLFGTAAAVSGGLAVVAAGCGTAGKRAGSGRHTGSAVPAAQPKSGGTLNYAGGVGSFDLAGRSWDPQIQTQSGARSYRLFYDTLLVFDLVTYDVKPWLAQSWEQPSETQYIFHLVPNVKWQDKPPVDGRAMTTNDILWSLERARANTPGNTSRTLLDQVDSITAPDAKTIKVTTKGPDASTLKKLATDNLAVLSQEVFAKYPKPNTADAAVGTGPFLMKSVEEGVAADYERNPNFWQPARPYLERFRTRNFPDAETAWASYSAGQIEITVLNGPTSKNYIASRGAGFTPAWAPDDTIGGFLYPNTKVKPMDDARVTRALRLLIDHDEMLNTWAAAQNGKGGIGGVFPPVLSAWDLSEQEYRSYPEWQRPKDAAAKEAASLLGASGYATDAPLQFEAVANNNPGGKQGVQLLQAQWKRLSHGIVDAQIKLADSPTIDSMRANRTFTYGLFGTSAGPAEPEIWLSAVYRSGSSQNFMGLNDATLDAMIDKQRTIFDETQRKALVRQIVVYLVDHGPSTIAATLFYLHAVQPDVQAYEPETHYLNGREFAGVWLSPR